MLESSQVKQALRRGAAWAAYTGADWLAEHLIGVIQEIDAPTVVAASGQAQGDTAHGVGVCSCAGDTGSHRDCGCSQGAGRRLVVEGGNNGKIKLQGEPLAQPSCAV